MATATSATIDFEINASLLDASNWRSFPEFLALDRSSLDELATLIPRSVALLSVIQGVRHLGWSGDFASERSTLPRMRDLISGDAADLIEFNRRLPERLGFIYRLDLATPTGAGLILEIGDLSLVVDFDEPALIYGSRRGKLSGRVRAKGGGAKGSSAQIAAAVIGGMILLNGQKIEDGILTAFPHPAQYVCTIDTKLRDTPGHDILAEAANDLRMPSNANGDETLNVIKSRQSCLKAAGVYFGPIDGTTTEELQKAEWRYRAIHNGVIVNWDSVVFTRSLIVEIAKAHNN